MSVPGPPFGAIARSSPRPRTAGASTNAAASTKSWTRTTNRNHARSPPRSAVAVQCASSASGSSRKAAAAASASGRAGVQGRREACILPGHRQVRAGSWASPCHRSRARATLFLAGPRRKDADAEVLLRILVTGGTGFIGGHVAGRLSADGHVVTILSRARSLPDGIPRSVKVCVGDLADSASLRAACADQDAVVHAAGFVGAGGTWAAYRRVNVTGTRLLIRAAVASGVPRLIHLSSLVVHAEPRRGEVVREASPLLRHVASWN